MNVDLSKLLLQDTSTPAPLNLKKYINYLLKKKLLIIIIAVIISIISGIFFPVYLEKSKKYVTSSVIRFDDPSLSRGISAVTDFSAGMEIVSKASLFQSSSFVESVVDSLNLNLILITPEVKRGRLFKKIKINPNVSFGKYTFIINDEDCELYYEDDDTKHTSILKKFSSIPDSGLVVNVNGLNLYLNTLEFKLYNEIEFNVVSVPKAVNHIKEENQLTYELDRTRTLMTISYEHSDPEFSPYVTNKVTDMFIKQLLEYKRFQTRSILETLDEQLKVAQVELNESEGQLRKFREANPKVFLSQGREALITDLANSQTQLENIQSIQNDISQMQQKLNSSNSRESKHFVYLEIISFLENQNVPGAQILSQRYQALMTVKDRLINENYNNDHPIVMSNNTQIRQMQNEIVTRLDEYQKELANNLRNSRQNLSVGQSTLRSLPRNELKLAELERNRQIKENILSSIMIRYNEAKITDAAIIPDAYIVDRATKPIVKPAGFIENLQFSVIGFFIGILIGIFMILVYVFFNKKIWSSQEVQDKIKLPLLALIPNINLGKNNNEFKNNETIDPKLVTGDYAPTLAGETFRKLRTLIDMRSQSDNKILIIGSLFPNEGKSLIAANLAISFAQQKKKTILIDGDLRRGVQHSTFAKTKIPGFTDLIIKKGKIDAKFITNYIQDTHIPNLFLLTSGEPIPNPSEALGSEQMERIVDLLKDKFDRIIFDSPPFGLSPDLMVMARYTKNIVLTLRSGSTNIHQFKNTLDEFGDLKEKITGLVINGSDEVIRGRKYQYSYYQY